MKIRILALKLFFVLVLNGCSSTPVVYPELAKSYAQAALEDSGFSSVKNILRQSYAENESGFLLLDSNEDGLLWRLALIDQAQYTLDLQYYLWYPEASARLIAKRLLEAADRGVRIRMILDDLLAIDVDKMLAAFDAHPNIELRLFNPWEEREELLGRGIEGLERLDKLNSRMHNKLLIADNQAVILGGRNIGDHYFGLHDKFNFHDLDVLGIGPVAPQGSEIFDHFWNSDWVQRPFALGNEPTEKQITKYRERMIKKVAKSDRLEHFAIEPQDWTEQFLALPAQLSPGTSRVIFDTVHEQETVTQTMKSPLQDLIQNANNEVLVVNAYIIPTGESGMATLKKLADQGVTIRILTNSLESNDVAAVNSHYEEWRQPIIATGAELYEMRADAAIQASVVDTPPIQAKFMGLHSKTMVVDRKLVFIGSMNFDPRSININTEMGVVIDSKPLGEKLADLIARDMLPKNSWQVKLDEEGDLIWVSSKGIETSQPTRGLGQQIENVIFKLFPREYY